MRSLACFVTLFLFLGFSLPSQAAADKFRLFQDYANIFPATQDDEYEELLTTLVLDTGTVVVTTIFRNNPWPSMEDETEKYYDLLKANWPEMRNHAVIVFVISDRQIVTRFSDSMQMDLTWENINSMTQNAEYYFSEGKKKEMVDSFLLPIYKHYYGQDWASKQKPTSQPTIPGHSQSQGQNQMPKENLIFGMKEEQFWIALIAFLVITTVIEVYVFIIRPRQRKVSQKKRDEGPVQRRKH